MIKRILLIPLLLVCSAAFSQQPIFATIGGGDLYSFDLTNCTRHFIGSTGQGFGDIAFTPDGRLWGIVSGQLYQIDTATANATLIGNTGVGSITLVGLNDSILLAEHQLKLYGINNNNAASYYIDSIGYGASGDLTWYDDDLYITTPLIKIVLNSTYTAILSSTAISLLVPTCEGAATASFVGDDNSIVGFNGPNLLKICQIDGSYQMLCPSLNIGGTPGAASIRLATQISQPTGCHFPNSIDEISPGKFQIQIFPNPSANQITIQTNDNRKFNFNIYNSLGQLVKAGNSEGNTRIIHINNLTDGIYSLELLADNKTEIKCFIVEKQSSR